MAIPVIEKQVSCPSLGLTNLIPKIRMVRNIYFRVDERKINHLSLKSSLYSKFTWRKKKTNYQQSARSQQDILEQK